MKRFICGMCNTHVYNYKFDDSISGKHVNADDFEPIKNFPQSQDEDPKSGMGGLFFVYINLFKAGDSFVP